MLGRLGLHKPFILTSRAIACMHVRFRALPPSIVAALCPPQVCYGQNVLLTGDCEELGAWDLSRSTRMEWSEGRNGEHHWSATITLPRGANVEYKFVIDDPRQ
jgi:hypothetical protein